MAIPAGKVAVDIVVYDGFHRKIWAMKLEIPTLVFETCIHSLRGVLE